MVICSYSTRYPEAIPLTTLIPRGDPIDNIDTETTSKALIEVFARFGTPREVLTDQGSNFMVGLMPSVYELLKVSHITATPYHPQIESLVERFNGILKQMLKKFVEENPIEWDKVIPSLLLAYRKLHQESTGFSPFGFLFGRHVREPVYVLNQSWEIRYKKYARMYCHK